LLVLVGKEALPLFKSLAFFGRNLPVPIKNLIRGDEQRNAKVVLGSLWMRLRVPRG